MRSVGNYKHGRLEELAGILKPEASRPGFHARSKREVLWQPEPKRGITLESELVKATLCGVKNSWVYGDYVLLLSELSEAQDILTYHRVSELIDRLEIDRYQGLHFPAKNTLRDLIFVEGHMITIERPESNRVIDIDSIIRQEEPKREKSFIATGEGYDSKARIASISREGFLNVQGKLWYVDLPAFVRSNEGVLMPELSWVYTVFDPGHNFPTGPPASLGDLVIFDAKDGTLAAIDRKLWLEAEYAELGGVETRHRIAINPAIEGTLIKAHNNKVYYSIGLGITGELYVLELNDFKQKEVAARPLFSPWLYNFSHFDFIYNYMVLWRPDYGPYIIDVDKVEPGTRWEATADYVKSCLKGCHPNTWSEPIFKVIGLDNYLGIQTTAGLTVVEAFR
jgi:hypothetical protein